MPRANVGGLLNLEGRTSAVYAGALWTIPLPRHFFAEAFLDADLHNGYLNNPPPGHSGLGCRYMFHDGGSLGYKFSQHWSAMFTFDHQSNGHWHFWRPVRRHGCGHAQSRHQRLRPARRLRAFTRRSCFARSQRRLSGRGSSKN